MPSPIDIDYDNLASLIYELRNDPNYLGNLSFSSESHTAICHSGPKIKFVSTTATGEEATVSLSGFIIAKVQEHNGWYHSEGTWGRPGLTQQFAIAIAKAQIRFLIGALLSSDGEVFEDIVNDKDFEHFMLNVKKLEERAFEVLKKSLKKPEMRTPFSKTGNYVIVGHKLFTERGPDDNDSDSDSSDESESPSTKANGQKKKRGALDEFSFDGYPACKAWKDEAKAIKCTHKISPLPACDETGKPIKPSQYKHILPGSIVKVSLTFTAYAIGTRAFALSAEIQDVNVLQRAKPTASTQSKRKFQDLLTEMKAAKKAKA